MQLSDQIAASPELMREFQKERLATEVGELVSRIMREKKITRTELADRLGTSRAFVTKLLRTGSNMTVRTLADVFCALGFSLRVVERPLSVFTPRLTVFELPSEHKWEFLTYISVPLTPASQAFSSPMIPVSKFTSFSASYSVPPPEVALPPVAENLKDAA